VLFLGKKGKESPFLDLGLGLAEYESKISFFDIFASMKYKEISELYNGSISAPIVAQKSRKAVKLITWRVFVRPVRCYNRTLFQKYFGFGHLSLFGNFSNGQVLIKEPVHGNSF